MIKDRIKIHDQYQFELKLNYALPQKEKNTSYNIDAYFFLPKHIDINKNSYKKSKFYNDMHTYIRLKTPTIPLAKITKGENSPFIKTTACLAQLQTKVSSANIENYEEQLKLFCCIVKSALRDHLLIINNKKTDTDFIPKLDEYIESTKDIAEKFHSIKDLLSQIDSLTPHIINIYNFCDEYLSILIETHTFELMEYLKKSEPATYTSYKENCIQIIKKEIEKRKHRHYPSIPKENDDNEEFIFRSSILKKYVSNILFLNTRVTKEGQFIEHLFLGIIAGIAMFIATAILFFSQYTYGSLTLQFFLAAVIGYMFKDRIKEILKYYVSDHLKKRLFDYKTNILSNNKIKIGINKESFNFIKENKIDPDILRIRNKTHLTEIENDRIGEKIIFYRKRNKIFVKKYTKIYKNYKIDGLTDILRLNIAHFTNKMDNEKKNIYILKDNDYETTLATRMYHINLILKYSSQQDIAYKRFRIILNRSGIKRIEKIV